MKKNTMMRLASFLLIAVLISTSAISGTYAKYVTQDSANDSARVAKWGVTAMVDGSLFGGNYNAVDAGNTISAIYTGSVDSANDATGDNIVAPGTKSDKGLKIGVNGKPEVKSKVEIVVDKTENKNYSDIYLKSANYGVMVNVSAQVNADNYTDYYTTSGATFTKATGGYDSGKVYYRLTDTVSAWNTATDTRFVSTDSYTYYPVVWTATASKKSIAGSYSNVAKLASDVESIALTSGNNEYNSLTDLAESVGNIEISWQWPFENTSDNLVDPCDTILGNMIAEDELEKNGAYVVYRNNDDTYSLVAYATDPAKEVTYARKQNGDVLACLTVGFNATVTVTQVD